MMSKRNNGIPNVFTRREFSGRLATFLSAVGIAGTAFAATGSRDAAGSAGDEEISHAAESIHQETVLIASRKRVYEALHRDQTVRQDHRAYWSHEVHAPGRHPTSDLCINPVK
ncbi:MAG TPA: hypothetical protein VJK29_09325 [Terriglobales bacterium]|nr:hypothetical protein [Terriglobales bacterium]